MPILIFLFAASLGGVASVLLLPGWSDLLLLAGPSAVASFVLLLRKALSRDEKLLRSQQKWVVVDGSNVMYWKDNTPNIDAVIEVVSHLKARDYQIGVMFDANAGYLITGVYQHDREFGKLLRLPQDRVMVVPKGTPADPYILTAARDFGAQIVTNDRFRDWVEQHPEIRTPGHLIRGGFKSNKLWLDLDENTEDATARSKHIDQSALRRR